MDKPAIQFYHLTRSTVAQTLPILLQKGLQADLNITVMLPSIERCQTISGVLWEQDPQSFLPHDYRDESNASLQPIWLSTDFGNPNNASMTVLLDDHVPEALDSLTAYDKILYLFDGNDGVALNAARARWKTVKDSDQFTPLYYAQNDRGGWEQKAA